LKNKFVKTTHSVLQLKSAVDTHVYSFIHSLFTFHRSNFGYNTSGYRNRQTGL